MMVGGELNCYGKNFLSLKEKGQGFHYVSHNHSEGYFGQQIKCYTGRKLQISNHI